MLSPTYISEKNVSLFIEVCLHEAKIIETNKQLQTTITLRILIKDKEISTITSNYLISNLSTCCFVE